MYWRLTVTGDFDYDVCAEFRISIDHILMSDPRSAVIDLSGLDYIDSSGLGILLAMSREYATLGGRLVLITNERVGTLLSFVRLNGVFATTSSMDAAVQALEGDTPTPWTDHWTENTASP